MTSIFCPRWPLIERHSSTRCQTPISSSSSSRRFSEKSLNSLSLSSTDHTKIMSFFVCPIMFSIPLFWRLERFFFLWQIFQKLRTSSAASRWEIWWYFFENAVSAPPQNVYFYHASGFLENSFFVFIKEIIISKAKRCVHGSCDMNIRGETIFILDGQCRSSLGTPLKCPHLDILLLECPELWF